MADPPPSPDRKAALRAAARAARRRFVRDLGDKRRNAERDMAARFALDEHEGPVALYRACGVEADPGPLLRMLSTAGISTLLPRIVAAEKRLLFCPWKAGDALVAGPYGIDEPAPGLVPVRPAVVVMPLVAFDRRGGRLGQGGGFYDRTLADVPGARRIGLAWSIQEVDAVPTDPWDLPLHAVLTEREWIPCR